MADTWRTVGALNTARLNYCMQKLTNGQVLIIGGSTTNSGEINTTSCELFNPVTETWTATGSLTHARGWARSVRLTNGKVMVVGGYTGGVALATCELYDPSTGTWADTGSLGTKRLQFGIWLLSNGKVMVAGGHNAAGSDLNTTELYDPVAATWSGTGNLSYSPRYPLYTVLGDGRPLISGGTINGGANSTNVVNVYDIGAGTWSVKTVFPTVVDGQQYNGVVTLNNGNALSVGPGIDIAPFVFPYSFLYNQTTDIWTQVGNLPHDVEGPTVWLLDSGDVLSAGGSTNIAGGGVSYSQIWDGNSWTATSSLNAARNFGTQDLGVVLDDGRPLVAGGFGTSNASILNSTEVYGTARSSGSVNITTSATSILAASGRRGFVLNNTGSVIVYLGMDSSVTSSTGFPFVPKEKFQISGDDEVYKGAIYGITASGTSVVNYREWEP